MNAALLAKAIGNKANALMDAAYDSQDDIPRERFALMRDVAELAHCARRMVEGKSITRAFGAPGDWGYGTPIGDALASPSVAACEEWQPIETVPKDGSYFLASNHCGVWIAHYEPQAVSGYVFDDPVRSVMLNHWHIDKTTRYNAATHWAPLPAPPSTAPDASPEAPGPSEQTQGAHPVLQAGEQA